MLALLLLTFQFNLFDAKDPYVLEPKVLLVHATRGEMGNSVMKIKENGNAEIDEKSYRENARDVHIVYHLEKAELKKLNALLKPEVWAKLPREKKANPMWPSAYDGMDFLIVAKVGTKTESWGNNIYDSKSDNELFKLMATISYAAHKK